jgi:hypothetical protein
MAPEPHEPKLLDQVRRACRARQYSRRTEEAYTGWIRCYVVFHDKRHPREMEASEVAAFLTHLANDLNVSASTQNQAASALLFLYREVLGLPIDPPAESNSYCSSHLSAAASAAQLILQALERKQLSVDPLL